MNNWTLNRRSLSDFSRVHYYCNLLPRVVVKFVGFKCKIISSAMCIHVFYHLWMLCISQHVKLVQYTWAKSSAKIVTKVSLIEHSIEGQDLVPLHWFTCKEIFHKTRRWNGRTAIVANRRPDVNYYSHNFSSYLDQM